MINVQLCTINMCVSKRKKMKSKHTLFTLASAMIMGGFGARANAENNTKPSVSTIVTITVRNIDGKMTSDIKQGTIKKNVNDTLCVLGTYLKSDHGDKKYIYATDKIGKTYIIDYDVSPYSFVPYIERGDKVVMRNGLITENLAVKKLRTNFVKGR